MLKHCLLFSTFLLLLACANNTVPINNQRTFLLNTTVVSKSPLPKEYFIKNYHKESIALYKEEKLTELQNTVNDDIATVRTFEKSDVLNLFGTPILIKNEGTSEVWQYKTTSCILNFIWVGTNPMVNTIKTYNNFQDDVNTDLCLKANISHATELEANANKKKEVINAKAELPPAVNTKITTTSS